MDNSNKSKSTPILQSASQKIWIKKLRVARHKLTPIVNSILAETLRENSENKYVITKKQYDDIVSAAELMREANTYNEFEQQQKYNLPNCNITVANVCDGNCVKEPPIVIEENVINELIKLYEDMGKAIRHIICNCDESVCCGGEGKEMSCLQRRLGLISGKPSKKYDDDNDDEEEFFAGEMAQSSMREGSTRPSVHSRQKSYSEDFFDADDPANQTESGEDFHDADQSHHLNRSLSRTKSTHRRDSDETFHDTESQHRSMARTPSIKQNQSNKSVDTFHDAESQNRSISSRGTRPNQDEYDGTFQDAENRSMSRTASVRHPNEFLPTIQSGQEVNSRHSRPDETCGHSVFIKMQCFNSPSSSEMDTAEPAEAISLPCATCKTHSTPHFHVKVGGKPIVLKVDQDRVEDGMVYCINTDSEDKLTKDIKIVIKRCAECNSTVVGSNTNMMESHESITLHGKYPETDDFEDDGDDEEIAAHEPERRSMGKSKSIMSSRSSSRSGGGGSKPKMDVILDVEDVTKSTIVVSPSKEHPHHDTPRPSVHTPIVRKSIPPLTRGRVCSSMEFDVSKVHTRLRTHEIEHKNPNVVLELRNLGVDKILRACRPAKCCRKAILDERQQIALPYTVSLKSLPLLANDVDVIKQSIDMSVRKIKNSTNLTQNITNHMTYFMTLSPDDFRPNINFPWVVPLYDVECTDIDAHSDDCKKKQEVKEEECKKSKASENMSESRRRIRKPRRRPLKKKTKKDIEETKMLKISETLVEDKSELSKGEGLRKGDLLQANVLKKSNCLSLLSKLQLETNQKSSFVILRKLDDDRKSQKSQVRRILAGISTSNPETVFKRNRRHPIYNNLSKEGIKYLLTLTNSKHSQPCRLIERRKCLLKRAETKSPDTSSSIYLNKSIEHPNSVSSFERMLDDCLERIKRSGYKVNADFLRKIQSEYTISWREKLCKVLPHKSYHSFEKECFEMNLSRKYGFEDYQYFLELETNRYNFQCPTTPPKYDTMFFGRKNKRRQKSHTSTNTNNQQLLNRCVMTEPINNQVTPTQTTISAESTSTTCKDTQVSTKDNVKNQETQSFGTNSRELMQIINGYQGHFATTPVAGSRSTVISELTRSDMQYINALRTLKPEDVQKLKQPKDDVSGWSPFVASTTSLPHLVLGSVKEEKVQRKAFGVLRTNPDGTTTEVFESINTDPNSTQNESTKFEDASSKNNDTAFISANSSKGPNESRVDRSSAKNKSRKDNTTNNKSASRRKAANISGGSSPRGSIDRAPHSTPRSSRDNTLSIRSGCSPKCENRCNPSRTSGHQSQNGSRANSSSNKKNKTSSSRANSSKNNTTYSDKCKNNAPSKFIQIQIEKKGNQVKSVEAKALNPCGKDICELYKNEHMVSSKKNKSDLGQKTQQKLDLSSNENIEIFVDDKKLSIINPKK